MQTWFADALVLRLTPFRETDVVVHLLTAEGGALPLLARGARRSVKRFGGALDYFCLLTAEVRPSRQGMGTLLGVELVKAFDGVRNDVDRYYAGCHFLEIVRRGAKEGDPSPELFQLLLSALARCDGDAHLPSLVRIFEVKALACLGYELALEGCPSCGHALTAGATGDREGRVSCVPCAPRGSEALSPGTLLTLRAAMRLPLDRFHTLRFAGGAAQEAGILLEAALGAALGGPLRRPADPLCSFREVP